MKTFIKKILIVATLFLGMQLSASAMAEYAGGSSGECCSAKSTLGGSCSVSSCNSCKCEGGFWSAECTCLDNQVEPPPRDIPNLTSNEIADANSFATYCLNYGTTGMTSLGNQVNVIMASISNNNQTDYTSAEQGYVNIFHTLSSSEVNDIRTWVVNKGYPTF